MLDQEIFKIPHTEINRKNIIQNTYCFLFYFLESFVSKQGLKLQLHDAIYRLGFYSNSLIHILSLSNPHNNVASIQKNRDDKSHRVIVALLNFYLANSGKFLKATITRCDLSARFFCTDAK